MSGFTDIAWIAERITWEGYEFLEASRNDETWKQAIRVVKDKGGGLVFDVLKQVLVSLAREAALAAIK